jgi:hypothetical protein
MKMRKTIWKSRTPGTSTYFGQLERLGMVKKAEREEPTVPIQDPPDNPPEPYGEPQN